MVKPFVVTQIVTHRFIKCYSIKHLVFQPRINYLVLCFMLGMERLINIQIFLHYFQLQVWCAFVLLFPYSTCCSVRKMSLWCVHMYLNVHKQKVNYREEEIYRIPLIIPCWQFFYALYTHISQNQGYFRGPLCSV